MTYRPGDTGHELAGDIKSSLAGRVHIREMGSDDPGLCGKPLTHPDLEAGIDVKRASDICPDCATIYAMMAIQGV